MKINDFLIIIENDKLRQMNFMSRNFSSQIIADLVLVTLLEYRVILISSISSSVPYILCEWLRETLKTIKYCHTYSPTMSIDLLSDMLTCPTPYLIGTYGTFQWENHLNNVSTELLVIDIDNNCAILNHYHQ